MLVPEWASDGAEQASFGKYEIRTLIFAIGRMPGWIAQFKEVLNNPDTRGFRPWQVYVGPVKRDYIPMSKRQ